MRKRKQKARLLVEELEPRILHSADAAALLGAPPPSQLAEVRIVEVPAPSAESASADTHVETSREIVFVDSAVEGYRQIVDDIQARRGADVSVHVLDNASDGVAQIGAILAGRSDIAAIHIVSHGSEAALALGSGTLDRAALAREADAITVWGRALAAGADLLIYGCDVAAGAEGRAFVDALARLTGADVAASSDVTGSAAHGGNWTMEYRRGSIEAAGVAPGESVGSWAGTLAIAGDTPSSAATATTASSLTFSHTVGTGTDRLLVVEIATAAAEQATSVTYGGVALTRLDAITESGSKVRAELWYLVAPSSGTADVVVTLGASKEFVAGATSFSGVDQGTPFGVAVSAEGVGGTPSITLAAGVGDVVIDVVSLRDRDSGAEDAGQTAQWRNSTGIDTSSAWGGSSVEAGAPSVTMSWTTVGAGGGEWAAVAVPIKAAQEYAPVLAGTNNLTGINEDAATNGGTLVSALIAGHVSDGNAGALSGIAVTLVDDSDGTWQYTTNGGTTWTAFAADAPSDANARLLAANGTTSVRFVPAANWNGTVTGGLSYRAWDQTSGTAGGTADTTTNGGSTAFSSATQAASIVVTPVNDAPVRTAGTPAAISVSEDSANSTAVTLGLDSLGYSRGGGADETGQTLTYTVTAIPAHVTLWLADGTTQVSANTALSLAQLQGLKYKTVADANGSASLTWTVVDDGGTANSGADTLTETLSIAVNAVNDAPVRTAGTPAAISVSEDSANSTAVTLGLDSLGYSRGGGADEAGQTLTYTVTAIPAHVTLWLADGTTQVSANTALSLAQLQGLKYKTVADANGSASLTWTVVDDGGTANSGADTLTETLSIAVTAVNDAPVRTAGTPAAISVSEDSANSTAVTLGLDSLGYSRGGGADETGQTLTYTVTAIPAHFTLWLADGTTQVSESTAVSLAQLQGLKYKTVADANGSGSLTWTVVDSGGTANGGADTLTETLSITVSAVNDAPVLTGSGNMAGINQNASNNGGTLVSDLIAGYVTDADSGAASGIAVTAVTSTNGVWQFSLNGGGAWTAFGTPSAASATLLAADALTYVRFVPGANYVGTVSPGLTYRAWDQTAGLAGASADTTASGGTTAFSAALQSASITVHAYPIVFSGSYSENFSVMGGAGVEMPAGYRSMGIAGAGGSHDAANPITAAAIASATAGNQTLKVWNPGDVTFQSQSQLANAGSIGDASNRALMSGAHSNAATVIELAMRNTTGSPLATISFAYDMKVLADGQSPQTESDGLPGYAFFYSLTGGTDPAEWISVPALYTTESFVGAVQSVSATIEFAAPLANNATMYFRWADDNYPNLDQDFAIDNVSVERVNNVPTLSGIEGGALAYSENAAATPVTASLAIADVDNARLAGATVAISANYASGQDTLAFSNQNGITGSFSAATGVLTLSGSATLADYQAALRSVAYANTSDSPSTATRTVSFVVDDGDATSLAATRNITVAAVNDAPVIAGTNDLGSINRNPTSNHGTLVADLLSGHASDVDAAAISGIAVTAVDNTSGVWQYSTDGGSAWTSFGTPGAANARLLAADINTFVRFVPNTNYSGTVANGLTFRAWDQTSGTAGATADASAGGGTSAFSASTARASIMVSASNTAPVLTGANDLTAISEDAAADGGTLVSALIAGMTSDVDPAAVSGIAVTAVDNANGTWQFSLNSGSTWTSFGTPSASAARLLAADAATSVRFVPNANWTGTAANGITFRAWDRTSGIAGSTANTSGTSGTFLDTFSTASYGGNAGTLSWAGAWVENDSQGGGAGSGRISVGGGGLSFAVAQAGDHIYRQADLSGASSAILSGTYENNLGGAARLDLQISANGGASYTTIATFDASGNGTATRSMDISAYIAADTRVRFLVVTGETGAGNNAFRFDNIQIAVTGANGGSTAFSTATAAADVTVDPVNDAPVRTAGTVSNLSVAEDAAATSLGLDALAYGHGGGADESAQTFTYTVTAVPAASLGAVTLADGVTTVNAASTYTLAELRGMQFRPATNANGGPATFSWSVADSGGTANGGADTLAESLTITVTAANDAPVLAGTNDLGGINRNPTSNHGTLVADLLNGHASDVDAAALSGIAVTAVDNASGVWQYSTDGGSVWNAFGAASAANARLLAADINTLVRFVPNTNYSGTVANGLTFRAWDQTSGTAGATADASAGGGTSAFSASTARASIMVSASNTAPVLTGANDLTAISEDAAADGGTLVSALIAGMTSDVDPAAVSGIAVTAVDNANGTWQFSLNSGSTWTSFGTPSASAARLLAADAATSVRFVPNANWNGTVTNGITFRAWDRTSGVAGSTADTTGVAGTYRDEFSAQSYSNSNGSLPWANPWIENDPAGAGAASGNFRITSGFLSIQAASAGDSLHREADLSGATGATLSFNYLSGLKTTAAVELQVSSNGGAYTTLGTFDASTNVFGGARSYDISVYISANTRIRWMVTGAAASDNSFAVGSVEILNSARNGGGTAFSTATASADVTVNAANDAPARTGGSVVDLTVPEDAPTTPLGLGALAYSVGGGADESAQTLTYTVTAVPAASLGSVVLADGTTAVTAATGYSLAQLQGMQFKAAPNANGGPATFSWSVADSGGTANGGVDTLAESLTITVTSVNDAPSGASNTVTTLEDTAYTFTVADFGYTDTVEGHSLLDVRIAAIPGAGSLTLSDVAVTAGQSISAAAIAAGNLRYTPAPDANGAAYASFTFQVRDGGGTASGGVDLDPSARTMTVAVTPVNDAPSGANKTVSVAEDTAYAFSAADFGFSDPRDSNALLSVTIGSTPAAGSLTLSGIAVTAGQSISAADVGAGNLRFTPAANANGAAYASFTFQVRDDGGAANGGVDLDPVARTMTVDVMSVNDAPSGANKTVSTLEDTAYVFSVADFGFADAADGDALLNVRIAALPAAGSLTLSGVAVSAGQSVSAADLASGSLRFVPAANANGAAHASFTFQVQDDGGTANGGVDLDPVQRTITVDVLAVSDAPAGASNTVTAIEDGDYVFAATDFGFSDTFDANTLLDVKIVTAPAAGSLTLSGFAVTAGQAISAADIGAGNLRFTPAANANGAAYASFTFQVRDDGGTANGGADLDPVARTMTIDVTPVNDAPSGASSTVATLEDTPYTFTVADFGYADAVDAAAAAGANALDSVRISVLPLTGTLVHDFVPVTAGQIVSAADIAGGKLMYMPALDGSGAAYASFAFEVRDDGGVANGGSDFDAVPRTMTIAVSAVNDAPAGADAAVTTLEDTAYAFGASDFGFSDASDGHRLAGVRIASVPAAGSLTLSGVAVAANQLVSAASIAAGDLVYAPAADANGAAYASFTFRVQDDGGTANGGIDLDAVARTMTIAVTAVNDAPSGASTTVTTLEDTTYRFALADFGFADARDGDALAAVRIVSAPAAGTLTLAGAAVGAGQTVSAASIAAGDLVYTPAADANGAGYASFTFRVQDDGGTVNGGVDFDPVARTLAVDVVPVNDAPTGTNRTATTNEGVAYTFGAADFGFADAADSPANALLNVRVVSLAGLGTFTLGGVAVAAGDVVAASRIAAGELQFVPAASGSGAGYASIEFRVQDDGGTASGGADTDAASRTLNVDVRRRPDPVSADPVVLIAPPPPPPAPSAPAESGSEAAPGESRAKTALARIAAELDAAAARALKVPVLDVGGEVAAPPARVETRGDGVASIAAPSSSAARRDGGQAAAVAVVPIILDVRADGGVAPAVLATSLSGRAAAGGSVASDVSESSAEDSDVRKQAYALMTLENGVRASAIIVSAGMVTWTLHGAGLLASLLTSAPAWRHLDPLPVLAPESEKPDWGDSDGDAQREDDAADRLWLGSSSRSAKPL